MTAPTFVRYTGSPDFHDGTVLAVDRSGAAARVRVRGFSGQEYVSEFSGVRAVRSHNPEGMFLYALAEMQGAADCPTFAFVNWEDAAPEMLEIDAESMTTMEVDRSPCDGAPA